MRFSWAGGKVQPLFAKLGQQGVEPRAGVVVLSPTIATESAGPNYAALEGPK